MRRFASIDFLRGFAIWLMLLLHVVMRAYDYSWANDAVTLGEKSMIFLVLMLVIMFLAGWAGFFLLISSIGNSISMQKSLKKGRSVGSVLSKQLLVGFLLLVVAFLNESITGYQGMLGDAVLGLPFDKNMLYRSFIAESIHAIAYAIIISAVINALLSIKGGYQKEKRNILIYLSLAVLIISITTPIYNISSDYGGIGTLQNFGTIQNLRALPDSGTFTVGEFMTKFFLLPFLGRPEPLLPYLATAFIGNAIGILMTREKPFWKEMKIGMWVGTILTFGGITWAFVMVANGQEDMVRLFQNAWSLASINAYIPMYLFTLGTQLLVTLFVIRFVEFRGIGKEFAEKTKYFRRHGFVALSIYNFQFMDAIPRWILAATRVDPVKPTNTVLWNIISWSPVSTASNGLRDNSLWGPWILLVIVVNFLIWYLILVAWEKVNYIGGFEWIINVIAGLFIKSKRQKESGIDSDRYPWWQPARLDVKKTFYNVEWLNYVEKEDIEHSKRRDSKLSLKITIVGLLLDVFIFFLPITLIGSVTGWFSFKKEGKNWMNITSIVLGILGFLIFLGAILTFSLIHLAKLGL